MRTKPQNRVLTAVLFTDIVGSTDIAAELGDRRWKELLRRHHSIVRAELKRFRGREVDTAGDGFFAAFDHPADAIQAAHTLTEQVRVLGIEIRVGINFGECELLDGKPSGLVVVVGSRTLSLAGPGEVLLTQPVRDVVPGVHIDLDDRGLHDLKGVPGKTHVFALLAFDGAPQAPSLDADEALKRRASIAEPPLLGRSRLLVALGVGLAAVVLGLVLVIGANDEDSAPPAGSTTATGGVSNLSVVAVDPETGEVVEEIREALISQIGPTLQMAIGEGSVWVWNAPWIVAIDQADPDQITTNNVGQGTEVEAITVAYRAVWISSIQASGGLRRLHPADAQVIDDVAIDPPPPYPEVVGVVATSDSVWAATFDGRAIEIEPVSGRVRSTMQVTDNLSGAAGFEDTVWVFNNSANSVWTIDARTGRLGERLRVQGDIDGAVATEEALWTFDADDGQVLRIEGRTGEIQSARVGPHPSNIAAGLGAVWVSDYEGSVFRIDPLTLQPTELEIGSAVAGVVIDEGADLVWLALAEAPADLGG